MAEGGAGWRRRGVLGAGLVVAAACLIVGGSLGGRSGGGRVLALQEAASSRLRSFFAEVHSNPNVTPVKGGEKALQAVEGLGRLPDLHLHLHKRKGLKDAVANAASKAGVKLSAAHATEAEKLRAKLAVAKLMHDAEGKAKRKLERPRSAKAQFHAKMANALFDYKLYKGQAGQRVHDAAPSAPIKGLQVGAGKARALRRKSQLHEQMASALLNYRAYQEGIGGGEDAKPRFEAPGRDIMLRTTQSLNRGEDVFGVQVLRMGGHTPPGAPALGSGGASHAAGTRFLCTQTGCRLRRAHTTPPGFSDAVPTSALPSGELTREMTKSWGR